ncbi:hypothetical protein [Sphingomonas sp. UYEF23]|uniref:hypothetical protein n=1 Tax=Sphingomonas sp. UYEF23 TaxID=1756408 RepID=UPI0033965A07
MRVAINQIEPSQLMSLTFSADVVAKIVWQLPPGLAVDGRKRSDGHPVDSGMPKAANPFHSIDGPTVPRLAPRPVPGVRRS